MNWIENLVLFCETDNDLLSFIARPFLRTLDQNNILKTLKDAENLTFTQEILSLIDSDTIE